MDVHKQYLRGESDAFIGRRTRLSRYLVCSMQGHFPVLIRTGPASLAVIYRTGAAHVGITGTLATAYSEGGAGLHYAPAKDDERLGAIPALFYARSADHGRTWSAPAAYRSALLSLASPYGHILSAPDGALLMGVYGRPREPMDCRDLAVLLRSADGGLTWGDETPVARRHNEVAYAFMPDGRLIAAARSESGHVATLHSDDPAARSGRAAPGRSPSR